VLVGLGSFLHGLGHSKLSNKYVLKTTALSLFKSSKENSIRVSLWAQLELPFFNIQAGSGNTKKDGDKTAHGQTNASCVKIQIIFYC
jgi:hypothetical protein